MWGECILQINHLWNKLTSHVKQRETIGTNFIHDYYFGLALCDANVSRIRESASRYPTQDKKEDNSRMEKSANDKI